MGSVAAGDEAAFEQLLQRYQRGLAAFIWRHSDGCDVDDIYQESWLRVLRNAGSFDRRRRFSTWLFQIALNLCRDRHRRRAVRGELATGDRGGTGAGSGEGDAQALVEAKAARDESARLDAGIDLQRLLDRLKPDQRDVLMLRYYQDLSEAEVSEILGIPRGTVKSRLHGAIKALSAMVAGDGDADDTERGTRG